MDERDAGRAGRHQHEHGPNRHAVTPTAAKLGADAGLTGRGVTIALVDSGFYPHPDIAGRVKAFHDVTGAEADWTTVREPAGHHWHGTQTAVACAGDGTLSGGVYAGLARQADLVLVKVSDQGRIPERNIELGLRWILEHRERLGIRVLNMSLGGDVDRPTGDSPVNQLANAAVEAGIVVVVAAGNDTGRHPIPPASAAAVITVGGYSDENHTDQVGYELYHSSYGTTADGLVKPELVAPAMYVAAPILPGTRDCIAAEALSTLAAAPDEQLPTLLGSLAADAALDPALARGDLDAARAAIERALVERNVVATHYQHVDGTSFAAPITASVVAQMIEANPRLTPGVVKNILIATARRLAGFPAARQGYGMVCAASAVASARDEHHFRHASVVTPPRVQGERVVFTFHDHAAGSVALAGDFNGWSPSATPFERIDAGTWRASVDGLPEGRYRYKLLVDGDRWVDDPSHGLKEDDGFGGFNSVVTVASPGGGGFA